MTQTNVLTIKKISLEKPSKFQPPKKKHVIIEELIKILLYSAKKKNANIMPEYSTL